MHTDNADIPKLHCISIQALMLSLFTKLRLVLRRDTYAA